MRPNNLSVRSKLLGLLVGTASVALILACATFVYYDRVSYSAAKQSTLSVLAESVAQSAYGPTAFGDPDSATIILKVLASEPSALAGAIYTQDGQRLAAWSRPGSGVEPPATRVASATGFVDGVLRISRPIQNAEGTVGVLETVSSTGDIAARTERFLLLAGGVLVVALLVSFGLALFGQRIVTRPVAILGAAAARVQEHQDLDVRAQRISGDELGTLTDAFNAMLTMIQARDRELEGHRVNLEDLVAQRTADLHRRNEQMRLVLDHVDQGFITIDTDGVMATERSAIVDTWFGASPPGSTLQALIAARDPGFAMWFEMGLGELRDGVMPPELVLDQMPRRFASGDRTYAVTCDPIGSEGRNLLVIVDDITSAIEHEKTTAFQSDLIRFFERVSSDRQSVEDFLVEAAELVASVRVEPDPVVQNRLIHTLKGNSALFGLSSFARHLHDLESALAEAEGADREVHLAAVVDAWKGVIHRFGPLLGGARRAVIEVERSEVEALAAGRAMTGPELRARALDWLRQPVAKRFERLASEATTIASRLGLATPTVVIHDAGIRLGDGLSEFWSTLVHAVRNALDHGLETPEVRLAAGKPAAGTLELAARRREGHVLEISVRDDGRGIDWDAVRKAATARGVPARTPDELVAAMFSDGLSTRTAVSELSGRGVGLGALRRAVLDLGGTIEIESKPGRGTCLRFVFDERRVEASSVSRRRQRSSLLPMVH